MNRAPLTKGSSTIFSHYIWTTRCLWMTTCLLNLSQFAPTVSLNQTGVLQEIHNKKNLFIISMHWLWGFCNHGKTHHFLEAHFWCETNISNATNATKHATWQQISQIKVYSPTVLKPTPTAHLSYGQLLLLLQPGWFHSQQDFVVLQD